MASRRTGLSIDTIRFYQRSGLLKPPARTAAGYRVFTEAEIAELQFIARAQDLGFSLAEIKELVPLRNEDGRSCPEVCSLIRRKLQNVKEKIAGLTELEKELSRAMRACDRALRAHAATPRGCPVIERIAAVTQFAKHDHRDSLLPRLPELFAGCRQRTEGVAGGAGPG